jgi:hypothetical protein
VHRLRLRQKDLRVQHSLDRSDILFPKLFGIGMTAADHNTTYFVGFFYNADNIVNLNARTGGRSRAGISSEHIAA